VFPVFSYYIVMLNLKEEYEPDDKSSYGRTCLLESLCG
jgi:hypothetical protein